MSIVENLAEVRGRIAAAAVRSGRSAESIKLVAVSKYVDERVIRQLLEAGCRDLGEARPQQLWRKAETFADADIHWHLIGHLQTNKVRRTLPVISLIHSIDSDKLLDIVNAEAALLTKNIDVLLEVNVSGDDAKHGLQPEQVQPLLERTTAWPFVARRNFATLRLLRDRLIEVCPPEVSLSELSMGMSGDYEAAIEEGATMVRVGSALFEGV
jgi:uncharacterized pyridoxal phosphate-containing UPF0001 family protein